MSQDRCPWLSVQPLTVQLTVAGHSANASSQLFTRVVLLTNLDLFQTGASPAAGAKAETWTEGCDHVSLLSTFCQLVLFQTLGLAQAGRPEGPWPCQPAWQCLLGTRGQPGSAGQYFSSLELRGSLLALHGGPSPAVGNARQEELQDLKLAIT